MTIYYVPFKFPNYESVRLELAEKYKDKFDPAELGFEILEWSRDNFLGLYDYVQSQFREKTVQISKSRLFFTPKKSSLVPHVDATSDGNTSNRFWSLNFPISVPKDNHVHQWYNYSGELIAEFNDRYPSSYLVKNPELLIPTKGLILDKPYFVNIGQIHGITNNSNSSRLILSLKLNPPNIFSL